MQLAGPLFRVFSLLYVAEELGESFLFCRDAKLPAQKITAEFPLAE